MLRLLRVIGLLVGVLVVGISAVVGISPGDRTPPSAWIVFESREDIYRMRFDGAHIQNLTNHPEYNHTNPQWSPDGKWIIFEANLTENWDLYRMQADGSNLQLLTLAGGVAQWSPDGQWIVFQSDHDIYRMKADGSALQNLTNSDANEWKPQWSPNGQWIMFVSDREGNNDIYRMKADGTSLQNLTQNPVSDKSPQWSPDGKWIVFVSVHSDFHNDYYDLYLMKADGSGIQALTQSDDIPTTNGEPEWSPDGQWIIFTSDLHADYNLYRIKADGSSFQRLTFGHEDEWEPQWSPDGQWIVFVSYDYSNDNSSLYRMRADGSEQQRLTFAQKYRELSLNPQWSPPLKRAGHPGMGAAVGIGLIALAVIPWRRLWHQQKAA